MPSYTYKAVTKSGVVVKNRIDGQNKQGVLNILKENELIPIQIDEIKKSSKANKNRARRNISDFQYAMRDFNTTTLTSDEAEESSSINSVKTYFSKSKAITSRDLIVFTQDFYLLKKANFNNIHALKTIISSTQNYMLKQILEDILAGVEAGENMYTTMEYYSDIFPYIYISMIKVGELSGSLTTSLKHALEYLEDRNKLYRKLRNIIIPNLIQFVLIIVMLVLGTVFAIPAIQNVYDEFGTKDKLPAMTIAFQKFMNVAIKYWYVPVILIVAAILWIISYVHTPDGRRKYHEFKYTAPIFGELIFAIDISRFFRAMLLNLQNGMRIQEAMTISKNVVKNEVLQEVIDVSMDNLLVGDSWIKPFEDSGLCKPMITEMLKIGMQTDLIEMIRKILEYLQIDIDDIMNKIMKTVPQIIYTIVGVILILFVVVVLVPCVQVYMGNFLFSAYL